MTFRHYQEFSQRVQKACEFSREKHAGQVRRGGIDYALHPIRVMKTVAHFTEDEDILCAAALHDVLEDTDVTYDNLVSEFGKPVADYVQEVTKDENKKFSIHTQGAAMIKAADMLHNVSDNPTDRQSQKYYDILNGIGI